MDYFFSQKIRKTEKFLRLEGGRFPQSPSASFSPQSSNAETPPTGARWLTGTRYLARLVNF